MGKRLRRREPSAGGHRPQGAQEAGAEGWGWDEGGGPRIAQHGAAVDTATPALPLPLPSFQASHVCREHPSERSFNSM